jgi:hypothetical protein
MLARHAKKPKLNAKGPLVDIICLLSDRNNTHFHHVLPRLVALGCKELAALVFSGRLKPLGIHIRSPSIEDRDGEKLAQIKASYDRFMTWYPHVYTVIGVTVVAPFRSSRDESTRSRITDPFFDFYDALIFTHSHTIQVLRLDLTTPSLAIISSFLDSVKMCSETRQLTLNMSCIWVTHKIFSIKAQEAIRYMYQLEHLSFSAFMYDAQLKTPADPLESSHLLYMLPLSLISLRLAGKFSPAMASFNEDAIAHMFCNNRLPRLTNVDLNAYRANNKPGRDVLVTRFAHPNSKVNRLVLPAEREASYMSLRLVLDQGQYLRAAGSSKPFSLVVYHRDPVERASRVDNARQLIEKYDIGNVQVEGVFD